MKALQDKRYEYSPITKNLISHRLFNILFRKQDKADTLKIKL
jgi:hypothetical protein